MQALRFILRLLGWLLTPLVAWAASFLGAILGASLATGVERALTGVMITVAMGLTFAVLGTHAWLSLVRRSPDLRAALNLDAEGRPGAPDSKGQSDPPPAPPAGGAG